MTSANLPPQHPSDAPAPGTSTSAPEVPAGTDLGAPPVVLVAPPAEPAAEPSTTEPARWLLVFAIIAGVCVVGTFLVLGVYVGATGDTSPGAGVVVVSCIPVVGPLVAMVAGLVATSRRTGPPRIGGILVLIGSAGLACLVLAQPFVFYALDDDPMLLVQIILIGGFIPGLLVLSGAVMGFLRPRTG